MRSAISLLAAQHVDEIACQNIELERDRQLEQIDVNRSRSSASAAPVPPSRGIEGTGARERLLDAAASLIIEHQAIDISLAEIAARAALNSALVKYYFGSKSGLLVALLQRDAARALAEMEDLLAMKISPGQQMRLHLRGIMNTYRRSPYLNRLLHAMMNGPDPAVRREVHRLLVQPVFDCQRRILADGIACREFRAVDHGIFYLSAIGACDQFMQTEFVLRPAPGAAELETFQEQYIAYVVDMVLDSLARRDDAPHPRTG